MLDPADMVRMEAPDRLAVYLAQYYEYFRDKPMLDVTPSPTPSEYDKETTRAKRMAIVKQRQYSTRPTKKEIEDIDEPSESSSGCESQTDFKKTIVLRNMKSSTYVEPDQSVIANKSRKISSPFLSGKPVSPTGEHVKKLQSSLPKISIPGSVADYKRRLSLSSSADKNSPTSPVDEIKPVITYQVRTEPIRLTVETKVYPHNQQSLNKSQVSGPVSLPESGHITKNKADVKPSSIFSGQPILRRHSQNQKPPLEKIGVTPMSIDLKNVTYKTSDDSKPKHMDVRRSPRPVLKHGKLNIEVKPLEGKTLVERGKIHDDANCPTDIKRSDSFKEKVKVEIIALDKRLSQSDEEKQEEENKTEIKRKQYLKTKREDSPRRSLLLASPATPDATIKDGDRVRNIWQSTSAKPLSPQLKRKGSFEVKIRPASLRKSREEKEMEKEQRNSTRSPSPVSRSSTPAKDLPKVNITVKPVSAQSSQYENTLEFPREPKETVVVEGKPPLPKDDTRGVERKPSKRRSVLSVVNQMTGSKSKDKGEKEVPLTPQNINDVSSTATPQSEPKLNAASSSESACVSDGASAISDLKQISFDLNKLVNQSDSDSSETPVKSSYNQEKEEAIQKCNSIVGLVKTQRKPPSESKAVVPEEVVEPLPSTFFVDGSERKELPVNTDSKQSSESDGSSSDSSSSSCKKRKQTVIKRRSPVSKNKHDDGKMDKGFLIGREKDPSKIEVAQLIQLPLELDRRQEELKRQEHARLQALHDGFMVPRDEVLEHENLQRMHSSASVSSKEEDNVDLDASSQEKEEMEGTEEEERKQEEEEMEQMQEISEELQGRQATSLLMPSGE